MVGCLVPRNLADKLCGMRMGGAPEKSSQTGSEDVDTRVMPPNGLELSRLTAQALPRSILALPGRQGTFRFSAARRVGSSELLGCRRHLASRERISSADFPRRAQQMADLDVHDDVGKHVADRWSHKGKQDDDADGNND